MELLLQNIFSTKTDKNVALHHHNERTKKEKTMPSEITDVEKFVAMSAKAKQCQVKRLKDTVKLKLRTPSQLYTLKIEPLRADEIIKRLQCEIKEEEKE
jgi:ferritin-like protein